MSYDYIYQTERMATEIDGKTVEVIVQLVADTTGIGDPRENDNVSTMLFFNHRRYQLGDRHELDYGEREAFEHGGLEGLVKHLTRQEGLIAFTLVGMYDHSGITIYPISKASEHPWYDHGGWDSGCLGLSYITQKRWTEMMGDADPNEEVDGKATVGMGTFDVKRKWADEVLRQEINEYDDWLRGNVWGLVATKPCDHETEHIDPLDVSESIDDDRVAACPHAETIESTWGYIGDPDDAWKDMTADLGFKALAPA